MVPLVGLSVALPLWMQAVPTGQPLRLDDAVSMGLHNHPTVRQAHAQTTAAEARAQEAKATYLPQVTGVASYQRLHRSNASLGTTTGAGTTTGTPTPTGTAPGGTTTGNGVSATTPSAFATGTFDSFTFGASASQLIYDFGKTSESFKAANRAALATEALERVTSQNLIVTIRRAYFAARTQKALAEVARDTLTNLERHLFQISEFVSAGVRPEIDLAQARTDLANGRAALIDAENGYGLAKAQLAQAMGDVSGTDYDIVDDEIAAVDGEDMAAEALIGKAIQARPEMAAFRRRLDAQHETVSSIKGSFGPSIAATAGASETGTSLSGLGPAWNVGVGLSWPLLEGGLRFAQVREAEALVASAEMDLEIQRLQIRVDVTQASLNIRAAKGTFAAATDAATNAKERLRLAEGRYASGLGNAIELSDAQLAETTALSQLAQAKFRLASARADLLSAMGRR